MSKFGWSYPPGAADDPFAPYNQDEEPCNENIMEVFKDFAGPYELYRQVYKSTPCGPTIAMVIGYYVEPEPYLDESGPAGMGYGGDKKERLVNEDLRKLGTWADLDEKGIIIHEIEVSSIVEGVDECTETTGIDDWPWSTSAPEELANSFWKAVDEVNKQALAIWDETHGCETCAKHWGMEEMDICPVWKDCPECEGGGTVI